MEKREWRIEIVERVTAVWLVKYISQK